MAIISARPSKQLILTSFLAISVCLSARIASAAADERKCFAIEVVDESTGRGVPLVELETINHIQYVTDSKGLIAVADADLMGQNVYFTVRSHGYEYPKDGFGFRGQALKVEAGGNATLKIKRVNVAERLYRTTGSGIYRDTVLLGGKVPIEHPLLQADVFGCDSVMAAEYRGKIYWFWGDTSRPHYPLGSNFHITGATSKLPKDGGLDPGTGVNFDYFVDAKGSVRPMAQMPGEGPTWISAVTVLKDKGGQEKIYACYVKIRNLLEPYRWGFVVWNDEKQRFEKVIDFDKKPAMFFESQTHSFLRREKNGIDYLYFTTPFPLTRVKADPASFVDPKCYEGFTCLKAGTHLEDKQLDRDATGRLRYTWKANTPFLTQKDQAALVKAGAMTSDEVLIALRDPDSGREVHAHNGSAYWNEYRKRWVLICGELNGSTSHLGEIWYAESDEPSGPWIYARKIATHDKYTFYNPKHHPFFDQDGGRTIFFEGTYTNTFSGNPRQTARYDYNQIMYRLDLASAALNLPVAFYDTGDVVNAPFAVKESKQKVAYFALVRPGTNTVAVYWDGKVLKAGMPAHDKAVLFYAFPANAKTDGEIITSLYEFVDEKANARLYSTDPKFARPGYHRIAQPVCQVWKMPTRSHEW